MEFEQELRQDDDRDDRGRNEEKLLHRAWALRRTGDYARRPAPAQAGHSLAFFVNALPLGSIVPPTHQGKLNQMLGRRYEVTFLRDKRWMIDCLAQSETEARRRAEELYADEAIDGVRVLRGRFGTDGNSYETTLLEHLRDGRKREQAVRIAASPSEEAWCETLADLYGAGSRRAITQLLRNFLDRFAITPTELLHHNRYIRLLDRQDMLQPQAVQRIAALQARARGVEMRQRLDVIDSLIDQATSRTRDALASRGAPRLGEDGLAALAEAIAERMSDPAEQAFFLRFAVSRAFEEVGSAAGKLEIVLQWAASPLPHPLPALIDELVSGLLGTASLVQDILGPQAHLAGAIGTLAALAFSRPVEMKNMPPMLSALCQLLDQDSMPETRLVLVDRIQRELATDKPLSRDDINGQRQLFEGVLDRLLDERGIFIGGGAMVDAIARRSRRFAIVGGVDTVRFTALDPESRMSQLVELAEGVHSERQQRVLATYMIEILDASRLSLTSLQPRLEALILPEAAKQAVIERCTAAKS